MTNGIAALLAVGGPDDPGPGMDQWATVLSVPTFSTAVVRIDGATATTTANFGWAGSGGFPNVNDRVIVRLIGKSLYIVNNFTLPNGSRGGSVGAQGAWGTTGPPNGTTGSTFSINRAGSYLFTCSASGYAGAVNTLLTHTTWIDGTNRGSGTAFLNPASTHTTFPDYSFALFLFTGSHYWWQQLSGASPGSDANDRASLSWVMI